MNEIGGVSHNPFLQTQNLGEGGKVYIYPGAEQSQLSNQLLTGGAQTNSGYAIFQQAASFVFSIIKESFEMFKGLIGLNSSSSKISEGAASNQGTSSSWLDVLKESVPGLVGSIFGPIGGVLGGLASKAGSFIKKLF